MTKKEFEMTHPDVVLVPAPITGGADVQPHDYFCGMCDALNEGTPSDAIVVSHNGSLVYLMCDEDTLLVRHLYGNDHSVARDITKEFLLHPHLDDIKDDWEDFSVNLWFVMDGDCIYIVDYYESRENLHNDARVRCVNIGDRNEDYMGCYMKRIQEYLENGNEEDEEVIVITTYQDGNDVVLQFWYKEKKTNI